MGYIDRPAKYSMDHTLILDRFLTDAECLQLIKENQLRLQRSQEHTHYGYSHADYTIEDNFNHPILAPANQRLIQLYVDRFPEITYMDNDLLWTAWRFKHFAAGDSFAHWHCEHNLQIPHRVLCAMFYLTEHPEGTEFMHYRTVIASRRGRAVVFPTFFTHVHRGQATSTDRYIMSNYLYMGSKTRVKPQII